MTEGKNRIMIYGPKPDTYIIEFKTAVPSPEVAS
jgi:hypothetical protein